MVSSAIWIKHARVSFSKWIKKQLTKSNSTRSKRAYDLIVNERMVGPTSQTQQ